jgi:AAA ATPase domain
MIGGSGRAPTGMAERGDVVERLLENASEGRGGALFVVGPAGLGKTTVLEHATTVAELRFAVGVGRGDLVEAVLPFGLIGQALNPLLDGRLPGGSMALDADGGDAAGISAQARFYGILRGVREAAVRPLLVALDDLHWSDPDSLTVIHLICRRLACLPVALIATTRPWPTQAVTSAQNLAAQGLAEIVALAPLSTAAARELLCSRVSGQVPAEVGGQAIELCGGNPLLVEQVGLELSRSGRLSQGQFWFSRFVGVGEAGRRYLQAVSVLGTRPVPRRPAARGRGRVGTVHPCAGGGHGGAGGA